MADSLLIDFGNVHSTDAQETSVEGKTLVCNSIDPTLPIGYAPRVTMKIKCKADLEYRHEIGSCNKRLSIFVFLKQNGSEISAVFSDISTVFLPFNQS